MKFSLYSCVVLSVVLIGVNAEGKLQCKLPKVAMPTDWITMVDPCTKLMKAQIQEELTASMTYLAMGAHFSKDTVNRPGFAKFFFDSASEERQHALKLIEYLLMRGELTLGIGQLIRDPVPLADTWADAVSALRDALSLEASVTRKLRDIASTCEAPGDEVKNFNDYHLVDWLTAEYLDEQYKGQRELAGKISELGKMMTSHGPLGEFLYDKKLLTGEPISF
jgi:ferritin heavy chain